MNSEEESMVLDVASALLTESKHLICASRNKEYGTPEENIQLAARLISEYLGIGISCEQVCIIMTMLKIARARTGKVKADTFMDMAAYASLAGAFAINEKESGEDTNEAA